MSVKNISNSKSVSGNEVYSLQHLLHEITSKVFATLKDIETIGDIAKEGRSEVNIARMGSIISTLSYGLTLHVSRNAQLINNIIPDTFYFDKKGNIYFQQ